MRKGLIVLCIALLLLLSVGAYAALRGNGSNTNGSPTYSEAPVKTGVAGPTGAVIASPTSAPTEAVEKYVDASTGGKLVTGARVKGLYGESGILNGIVENGEFSSDIGTLTEDGEITLNYIRIDNERSLGKVEMIAYPQKGEHGEVYLEINGVDSGCKFVGRYNIGTYIKLLGNQSYKERFCK